jgi:hypothetical protein
MANPIILGGVGSPQSIFASSSTQEHTLGTLGYLDERTFRYASFVGGTALNPGQICAATAIVATHQSAAYASGGAAGANTATITLGAVAATEGQYKDGWYIQIDGTGSGQYRRIKSHPAAAASATLELTFYDPIETALGTGEVTLVSNQYSSVILHPGDDSQAIGVPAYTIPDGSSTTQYFWLQTGGPAAVWGDSSQFVAGDIVVPADATADAGQATILAGTTVAAVLNLAKRAAVGRVISGGDASDADYRLVHLTMDQ